MTDALSQVLLVSEPSGVENLKCEGVDERKIHLVGNVMIDTLAHELPKVKESRIQDRLDLKPGEAYFSGHPAPAGQCGRSGCSQASFGVPGQFF